MTRARSSITRRRLMRAGAAAVAAGLPMPAIAQALRPVRFTTSWVPEGPNLFAYVARDRGFWKERGLDVSVARGSGSGTAIQTTAADTFDFGMGATPTVIIQASKGLGVTCIGQINYDALMGVGVLADSPIKSPKDLEGKTLGASVTSGEYPFLPLYADRARFDFAKVKLVQIDAKVRERSLLEKQVDAVSAFATSTIPTLASKGTDVRFFKFSAVRLDFYGQSLITQPKRVQADAALCAAFVDGAMAAIKFSMTNPDEALDLFLKANDEVRMNADGAAYVKIGLGLTHATNLVSEVKDHGFGYADPAKVQTMADIIVKYGAGADAKRVDAAALFTNAFAGRQKLSAAEEKAVTDWAKPYTKYLG
jgi:NitT/TauT family transport system substrate-binding protein